VIFVATIDTQEFRLSLPIVFRYMAAARASLTGVVRQHGQQHAAVPCDLVVELPPELAPALVENGAIQPGLLAHPLSVLLTVALGRPGHVAYLQILNTDERVVLADRCCGLMQEVFAGISDAGVNLLNFGFRLLPVVAELDLAAHATLVARQALLVFLEAVERRDEAAVAHRGEAGDADIDADGRRRRGQWLFDLALRLNRREPLAARLAHGDIAYLAQHVAAVAVTQPAEFGEKEAVVTLIELDLFRVGIAESIAATLALKFRKVGAFLEEIFVGLLQVLQGMLQGMAWGILEPRRFRTIAPPGQVLRHGDVADELVSSLVIFFLHRQRLVVDEPA